LDLFQQGIAADRMWYIGINDAGEDTVPNHSSESPLDRTFRFLAFGGIGTVTGFACVELSRSLWLQENLPVFAVLPACAYAALILATVHFRVTRSERISHGLMLLGGVGLLLSLLPYMLTADRHTSSAGTLCEVILLFTLAGCFRHWLSLYLRGQSSAAGRGALALFLVSIAFRFLAGFLYNAHSGQGM
jgi:putative flippase GtrA